MKHYQAAEAVTKGHPDKLCDQIADAILDEYLKEDPRAHVATEVMATAGFILIAGEISSSVSVNATQVARRVVQSVGYDPDNFEYEVRLHSQSPDITQGVKRGEKAQSKADLLGAGDQGIVYGYATNETSELLPLAFVIARRIIRRLDIAREEGIIEGLCPDGKSLVVVEYEDGVAQCISSVVVSAQHEKNVDVQKFRSAIYREVISYVLEDYLPFDDAEILINPTGSFVIGGADADTGLTGRKLAVDSYGGLAKHGGGAFSGKDPTKVDRSGAYMARLIARSVVLAGFADRCEVSIAYAIGKAEPLFFDIDCFGTNNIAIDDIKELVQNTFPMAVAPMIDYLRLRSGGYEALAVGEHFGGEGMKPWESSFGGLVLQLGGMKNDHDRTI